MGAWRSGRLRVAGGLVAVVVLVGCATGPVDGGDKAQDTAEAAARRLNDDFGRPERSRDAESIAATEIPAEPHTVGEDGGEVVVTALSWSGRTYGDEQAVIVVRFVVTVAEQSAGAFGARGNTAGGATVCYRYTLQLHRDTGYKKISCPAVGTPPVPSASPPLQLPADTAERLATVLRTATPETLAGAVRAAFPQPGITVDTVTQQGVLVAAVGVPAERDCVVMIRTVDGETKQVPFDRIQLEPGEMGCATGLYTNPVR